MALIIRKDIILENQMNLSKILLSALLVLNLEASDDINIDDLLHNIEIKTDLSAKTKLENGGISYIYTREDIRKMQAHNLKDILKSTYPMGYSENEYGYADSYTSGNGIPFVSSSIKIYIDNQEITTGLYGSGFMLYGNMDIDFVDHIEVYGGNPTFEYSSEPAFSIIKLYSKTAQKDGGTKLALGAGSYGAKYLNMHNANELKNGWSYFTYGSLNDNKRKRYKHYNSTLSRDSKTAHLFASLSKKNNKILFDVIREKKDAFIGQSIFATPLVNEHKNDYLHIGYDTKYNNLAFLASFEQLNNRTNFQDANKDKVLTLNQNQTLNRPYSLKFDTDSQVYTLGIKYHLNFEQNRLLIGSKYREKHYKFDIETLNDTLQSDSKNDKQTIATIFLENQYIISQNSILTSGIMGTQVKNNYSVQNDDLLSYRFGYTYANKQWVSKTIVSQLEFSLDPYLVNNSLYLLHPTQKLDKEQQSIYMQNVKYQQDNYLHEAIFSYVKEKNKLMSDTTTRRLDTYRHTIKSTSLAYRYKMDYRSDDNIEFTIGKNKIKNIPIVNSMNQYSATLRNFNRYKKFDFFNEILYYRNDIKKKDYFDYTLSIIYHKTDDLSISLKGTNLLNKARESQYYALSPDTFQQDAPLSISPIDQSIMLSLEYTF